MTEFLSSNFKFEISDRLMKIEPGRGGLPRIAIRTPAAQAQVYLHGAHVTHFQRTDRQPLLFLSKQSQFAAGQPIRGGVPIIFPWFGPRAGDPSAPAHGFARTRSWELLDAETSGDRVILRLALSSGEASREWIPEDFEVTYTISVGDTLDLALEVRNRSAEPLAFEEALHTYFVVGDVRQVSIEGLSGRTYIDKTAAMARKTQEGPIRIEKETDRVYVDTSDEVTVIDPAMGRRIVVAKKGSQSTVVWNPWIDKAKAMADFGDDEWPGMLCVETANVGENAVRLEPGQTHVMTAAIGSSL